MNLNDRIKFRFVTRTLSEDFRVFYYEGSEIKQLDDNTDFAPLRSKGDIIPEDGPCAVIFEENGKIFLVVSSLRRGVNDRVNRPIRFSFCLIFSRNDKFKAYNAFRKVILSLDETEKKVRELIREIPVMRTNWQNKQVPGEDVEFGQKEFIDWLQEGFESIKSFRLASGGKRYAAESFIWPAKKYMLKWEESSPDVIECRPVCNDDEKKSASQRKTVRKFLLPAAVFIIIVTACALYYFTAMKIDVKEPQEVLSINQHIEINSPDKNINPESPASNLNSGDRTGGNK